MSIFRAKDSPTSNLPIGASCLNCGATDDLVVRLCKVGDKHIDIVECRDPIQCWIRWDALYGIHSITDNQATP